MSPGDRGEVAGDGAVGAAGAGERGQIRGDDLGRGGERLEPPAPAPVLKLAPVAGIGAQGVGAARAQAIAAGGLDLSGVSSG